MADEFVLEEVPEIPLIPEGEILAAEVVKVEKQVKPWKKKDANGNDTDEDDVKVSFEFRITEDGEFKKQRVWGETPTTFSTHSDCKLKNWVVELLGQDDLPTGFRFNTDTLSDLPCRVAIAHRTNKKTKKVSQYVTDVIRAGGTQTAEEIF